ncbi:hypothetical protein LRS13_01315 [Svornostia abyssi]|uniref:Uncharacterized protein n=1 Tax=Svornostia abyssi TaxID=2898438 RepID=A0ABY5PI09_9ACTN|nr:hypothetical protein LRS13_01315 [Parviterribacteraceae bacterium J379]
MSSFLSSILAADAPAGGAAMDQVVIATLGASVATAVLLWVGLRYRAGHMGWLRSIAGFSERTSGMPSWAAVPAGLGSGALIVALFGMYWDISLHIDKGRDEGPLANPAHYFILIGLYGVLAAGFLSLAMADGRRESRASVRIAHGWNVPLGGLLMVACGAYALLGFPLDDLWHRMFGQDVTLWGPTHLMLIGGAVMGLIGLCVLISEGLRAPAGEEAPNALAPIIQRTRAIGLMGGLLVGLATFQAEFDWGVPQFNLLLEPVLLAASAGIGLVCARLYIGPGGAIAATLIFLILRGALALAIGPVLGQTPPDFALYLPSAILVELVFLAAPAALRAKPYVVGALAGFAVGTVGTLAEYGWSQVWMPIPWPSGMLAEALLVGTIAGVAGGVVGAFMGGCLNPQIGLAAMRPGRILAPAATAVIIGLFGVLLATGAQGGVTGTVTLRDIEAGPDRTVAATVRVTPDSAADDVRWLTYTAWQGDGFVINHLRRVSDGVYETTEPVPAGGDWKAMVRLHQGDSLLAMPVHMPEDRAIPAPEIPATAAFTRPFVADKLVLQREAKTDVAPWLWTAAGLVVLLLTLLQLGALGWGLLRLSSTATPPDAPGGAPVGAAAPRTAARPGRVAPV